MLCGDQLPLWSDVGFNGLTRSTACHIGIGWIRNCLYIPKLSLPMLAYQLYCLVNLSYGGFNRSNKAVNLLPSFNR